MSEYVICTTVVNDKVCEIWKRDEIHGLGEANEQSYCDNWWVRVGDEWVPWTDRGANRVCWEINIKQGNRTKHSYNDVSIRTSGHLEILCNKYKVYEFGFGDINWAMNKAQVLMTEMTEHPFNFAAPDKEVGRKIWYYNQPAYINRLILDQGSIMIKKDGEGGFDLSHPWDDEDGMHSEWDGRDEVKDDIFTHNINWFRK